MSRKQIGLYAMRALYSESMGRCMNPDCQKELFISEGDISEKAHIIAYCDSENNSFDNLVILCPTCHTKFDKLHLYTAEQVREWKKIRKKEVTRIFCKKFNSFDELSEEIAPLLLENKLYFESYYLNDNKTLWDKFECKILINNRKIKDLLENNLNLFQSHPENKDYSNLHYVEQLIVHINEFEATRYDKEKIRQVLFPNEVNSIFGIAPVNDYFLQSTESLECLIANLKKEGVYKNIVLGIKEPYISYMDNESIKQLFLKDTPRLRQLYYNYKCFRGAKVRFESLNFSFSCLKSKKIRWKFLKSNNLREISMNGINVIFVYEYCLSDVILLSMLPDENSIIVNLHTWNGERCVSKQAYIRAKEMKVTIMTMDEFREYINEI